LKNNHDSPAKEDVFQLPNDHNQTPQALLALYQNVKQFLESKKNPCLIIDDISILYTSGFTFPEIYQFLHSCQILVEKVFFFFF